LSGSDAVLECLWVSCRSGSRPEPTTSTARCGVAKTQLGRKRGNNEGSIFPYHGRWAAAISLSGGRRKYLYGRTREEVRRLLADALSAREHGTLADTRGLTLGSFLDIWLSEVAKPSVRHWTYKGYEVHVRLHLKPALGRLPLDRVEPTHVQSLLNAKLKSGLSPKSVRYILGTLRTALNQANRWGYISRNPAALVDGPRVERYEIQPLSLDEARTFLAAIKGDRLQALYSVALTMGLRQGEALGLRWQDVDLSAGTLRVSKQLQRIDGEFKLVEPKTSRSRRTLALPATAIYELKDHCLKQRDERMAAGARWSDMDLVFTRPDGGPLDGTVVTHQFHRLLDKAGLPQRRFHDLRHSCATLLLAQGVSPRVVMEILGHSQIALTMNTYTHVLPELKRDAARRMDEAIRELDR
jgi:integrase